MPTDTTTDLVSNFYPLPRQQLDVPAIPLLRLKPIAKQSARDGAGSTAQVARDGAGHTVTRQAVAHPFTVAARMSASHSQVTPPVEPSRRLPDVRFAVSPSWDGAGAPYTSNVGWATEEISASPSFERVAVAQEAPMDNAQAGLEPKAKGLVARYPFWMTALAQIVIGTLIVILLVKFANLVRDSFGIKRPVSASTVMGWEEGSERSRPLVQPAESAVSRTEHGL